MLSHRFVGGTTLLVLAVLGAIGIGVGVEAAFPATAAATGNRLIAEELANRLLSEAALPAGTVTATGSTASSPKLTAPHPAYSGAISLTRRFVVPLGQDATVDYLTAHMPKSLPINEQGSGYSPSGYVEVLVGALPSPTPPILQAQLGYSVAALASNRSVVLVDAFVAYDPDRPSGEVVPADASRLSISFSYRPVGGPSDASAAKRWTRLVTDRAEVARLSTLVNEMPAYRSVSIVGPNCDGFVTLGLDFSAGSDLVFDATASTCGLPASVWTVRMGKRVMPALSDWNGAVFRAIESLVGSKALAPLVGFSAPTRASNAPGGPIGASVTESPRQWYAATGKGVSERLAADASMIERDGSDRSDPALRPACRALISDTRPVSTGSSSAELQPPPTPALADRWAAVIGEARALGGACQIPADTPASVDLPLLAQRLQQQLGSLRSAVSAAP